MNLKILSLCTILLIFSILAAGCTSEDTSSATSSQTNFPTDTLSSSTVAATQAPKATTVAPVKEASPIKFSGSGDSITNEFTIGGGLTVFDVTHSGTSNVALWLYNDAGNKEALLVNEIGKYNGEVAEDLASGSYLIEVTADGSWSITVKQPRTASAPSTKSFSGAGDTVTDFFTLDSGANKASFTNNGDSNFAVWLYDQDGRVDLLVNEIGSYSGNKILSGGDIYCFAVVSDGNWKISIQ